MAADIDTAGLEGILQALLFGGMPNSQIAQAAPLLGGLPNSSPGLPGGASSQNPNLNPGSALPSLSPEALMAVLGSPVGGLPSDGSIPQGNFLSGLPNV